MLVSSPDVMVTDASGIPVNCQVDLVWNPELDLSRYKVLFTAEVPAVGFATYTLKKFVVLLVFTAYLILLENTNLTSMSSRMFVNKFN